MMLVGKVTVNKDDAIINDCVWKQKIEFAFPYGTQSLQCKSVAVSIYHPLKIPILQNERMAAAKLVSIFIWTSHKYKDTLILWKQNFLLKLSYQNVNKMVEVLSWSGSICRYTSKHFIPTTDAA